MTLLPIDRKQTILASAGTAGNTLFAIGAFQGADGDPVSNLTPLPR